MKLIEFFGLKVKPRITNGKRMFKPLETGRISNSLYAIRDKDVNSFLIKISSGYIAIDSGYKNSQNMRNGLEKLGIDPHEVKAVFLTHLDIDHAGGCDVKAGLLFKDAKIYLSQKEFGYITRQECRKKVGPFRLRMPIKLPNNISFVSDNEIIDLDGVKIKAIFAPGHSVGHTVYVLQNIMFIGDALISDGNAGWCFYDFWNMDSELNKKTLTHLEQVCKHEHIDTVITSHSGIIESDKAFINKLICPNWREKDFIFIKDGLDNPYK